MTTLETAKTDLTVANTIAKQIGGRAFYMMGTRAKIGDENSLQFDVRGAKVNKVIVKLDPCDTYTVQFWKVPVGARAIIAGQKSVMLKEVDGVYADGLCQCIEANTGLRLSL